MSPGNLPASVEPDVKKHKKKPRRESAEEKAALRAQEKELREQQKAAKRARRRAAADALYVRLQAMLSSDRSLVVLAAIDVEAWEQDQGKVTEIGLAVVRLTCRAAATLESPTISVDFRHRHLLVKEHLAMRNGRFVEDNKDSFLFGDSELVCLEDAGRELSAELHRADFIVGQAPHGDLKWLRDIGVTGIGVTGEDAAAVVDTQLLAVAGAGPGVDVLNVSGLKALADHYALDPRHLHNAGNDAAFTAQVCLSQLGVAFTIPDRAPSRHLEAADFQAAAAEAEEFATASQSKRLAREEELRAQVRQFAEEAKKTPSARVPDANLERSFPADLTSAERRVVHEAAEALGLGSRSATGTGGERCVSILLRPGEPGQWRHARRRGAPKTKSGGLPGANPG